ncbi:hypothetical protein CDEST_03090 [Colletotrichum destructivum]|uniref:Uncharacterized protein n=1 Tax=Colletotrichum destructivum TaxID=34406 RepID=A0AAX4I4D0_9PEZI|nr:hypothetical protein CDEST_03090 [Colletotrichum destructivum]
MKPKDAWQEVLCGQVELAFEIGCRIVRVETGFDSEPRHAFIEAVGLGRLESKQRVSNGERKVGWVYSIDEETWGGAREDLKRRVKCPL